jgi:hypothetical protein
LFTVALLARPPSPLTFALPLPAVVVITWPGARPSASIHSREMETNPLRFMDGRLAADSPCESVLEELDQLQPKQLSSSKDINPSGYSYSIGTEMAQEIL